MTISTLRPVLTCLYKARTTRSNRIFDFPRYRFISNRSSIMSAQAPLAGSGTDYSSLVQGSTDSTDQSLVIRQIIPGMLTFSVPFNRFSTIPIGGRSTAIRLTQSTEKGIFVYASSPLSPATKSAIEKLSQEAGPGTDGQVKWLVAPDGEHAMHMYDWQKAFPEAKAIGVTRHKEQKPDVKWAGLFGSGGDELKYGFEPEISLHSITQHTNHELVAIHHPSKTLLEADLMFNLPAKEQFSRAKEPLFFRLTGVQKHMQPGSAAHDKAISGTLTKGPELQKELKPLLDADIDRIIPCHGDVIETGGKTIFEDCFRRFMGA